MFLESNILSILTYCIVQGGLYGQFMQLFWSGYKSETPTTVANHVFPCILSHTENVV